MADAQRELGDVFAVDVMGLGRLVLLADPRDVEFTFTGPPEMLRTGESNALVEPLLGPSSLLVLDAPRHMPARRQLAPFFTKRAIDDYASEIERIARQVVSAIVPGQRVKMHALIRRITLRVMLTIVFGSCSSRRLDDFFAVFAPLTGEAVGALAYLTPLQRELGPLSPGHWLRKKLRALDELIYAEIGDRRRSGSRELGGVLGRLVEFTDGERPVADAEIRDQVVTLLAAGHETVGSAVAWAFDWIHRSPRALQNVRDEISGASSDYRTARYLEASCLEAMRMTPVAEAVSRVTSEAFRLRDFEIDEGALLSPAIHLVHHRPDLYPEPERFVPERFLDRKFGPNEYFPFGGGQRRCLGHALAMAEMSIILGSMLTTFEFQLLDRNPPRGVRRNVTIAPARGVPVVAKRSIAS